MRYFVIGEDGQKYGPADVATLNGWIAEGRLLATQQVEEEASGVRTAASAVPGLNFPVASPQQFAPGQPYQQHYVRPDMMYGDDGSRDAKNAYTMGIIALVCIVCCGLGGIILSVLGLQSANRALAKGNQSAQGAKVLCIVALCLTVLRIVAEVCYGVFVAMNGK